MIGGARNGGGGAFNDNETGDSWMTELGMKKMLLGQLQDLRGKSLSTIVETVSNSTCVKN